MTDEENEVIPPEDMSPSERLYAKRVANLEAHRSATQYGGERANKRNNDEGGAGTKAWSIRHSLRYLAGQPLDMKNAKDAFSKLLPPVPTVAQIIAAQSLAKATKADMRAVEYVTEQIDGKLAQPNLNADLAAMENMTDEQLYDIIDRFNSRYTLASPSGESDSPAGEKGGSETPA